MKLEKHYDTIQSPIITEKATLLSELNQVVFRVPLTATKLKPDSTIHRIPSSGAADVPLRILDAESDMRPSQNRSRAGTQDQPSAIPMASDHMISPTNVSRTTQARGLAKSGCNSRAP